VSYKDGEKRYRSMSIRKVQNQGIYDWILSLIDSVICVVFALYSSIIRICNLKWPKHLMIFCRQIRVLVGLDFVPLPSNFFPAKFFFCILEKGILMGKNLLGKIVNLLCKEGSSNRFYVFPSNMWILYFFRKVLNIFALLKIRVRQKL
jgi:hypothetical protein